VSAFCEEHSISRKTFYALRRRALEEGEAAVLEPRSRRPRSSPTRVTDEVTQQALEVRASLEASGLDHGPISVHDKLRAMGLVAPSIASLARIFRSRGVARLEPRKKPRSAYRRFVYPAPNACWQLDATQYVLAGGRRCVIFQLEDDHSRVAVASHVAASETAAGAIAVLRKGIEARGVPQRLLTDNGAAMNPSRRGWQGALVSYANAFGVAAITSRPGKPTTQGKNERFHQTLFRWLDKQPLAATMAHLQEQVDRFDVIYNTQRGHQGLPGRITPQTAWDATPVAEPPVPMPEPVKIPAPPVARHARPDEVGEYRRRIRTTGSITVGNVIYQIGAGKAGQWVHATIADTTIAIIDAETGELLFEHPLPPAGTRYVGNGKLNRHRCPET
jgi:putative transposase